MSVVERGGAAYLALIEKASRNHGKAWKSGRGEASFFVWLMSTVPFSPFLLLSSPRKDRVTISWLITSAVTTHSGET